MRREAKLTVKDRLTRMVRDVVAPQLKRLGFRHRGRVLWRDGKDVCHVITFAMNRWGSRDESLFTVHLGVFWHQVEKVLRNPSVGRMPPPDFRCTFSINLGTVVAARKKSYEVRHDSDFEAIGESVLADLLDRGLGWFKFRSD